MTFRATLIFLLAGVMNSSPREEKLRQSCQARRVSEWQDEGFIFLSLGQPFGKLFMITMALAFFR